MEKTNQSCDRLHAESFGHRLFLCISSLICLRMIVITLFTINSLKTQVVQTRQQKDATYLTSLEKVYEDMIQRYSRIAQNIYADTYVNVLVTNGDNSDISDMMRISKYLSGIVSLNPEISSIMLYRGNQVLASYSGCAFYATDEEKMQMLSMITENTSASIDAINLTYHYGQQILFSFQDMNRYMEIAKGVILVIDQRALQDSFCSQFFLEDAMILIEDRSRGLVLTNNTAMAQTILQTYVPKETPGVLFDTLTVNGEKYLCTTLTNMEGVSYCNVLNYAVLLQDINTVQYRMLLLIVSLLALLVILSYFLAIHLSHPVRSLLNNIIKSLGPIAQKTCNETFEDVSVLLTNAVGHFEYMKSSLAMTQLMTERNGGSVPHYFEEWLADQDSYMVAVLKGASGEKPEDMYPKMRRAGLDIDSCKLGRLASRIQVLIVKNADDDTLDVLHRMYEACEETVCMAVSTRCTGSAQLESAIRNCLVMTRYCLLNSQRSGFISTFELMQSPGVYTATDAYRRTLLSAAHNCVKSAFLSAFEAWLSELSQCEINSALDSIATVYAALFTAADEEAEESALYAHAMAAIDGFENAHELRCWLTDVFETLFAKISQESQRKMIDLKNKITGYIEMHYARCDLCLDQIADALSMSRSSLSRLFNSVMGESFPTYLRRYRLTQAYKMLRQEPQRAISEIAQAVGYSSNSYFTLSFRQEFGMPPSQVQSMETPHKKTEGEFQQ